MKHLLLFLMMTASVSLYSQQVVWERVYDNTTSVSPWAVQFHEATQQVIVVALSDLSYLQILTYDPAGNLLFDSIYTSHTSSKPVNIWETPSGKYIWTTSRQNGTHSRHYMTFDPVTKVVDVITPNPLPDNYQIVSQDFDHQNRLATLSGYNSNYRNILRVVDTDLNILYEDSLPGRYMSLPNAYLGLSRVLFSPDGHLHMFWNRNDTLRYLQKNTSYNSVDSFDIYLDSGNFKLLDVELSQPNDRVFFMDSTTAT